MMDLYAVLGVEVSASSDEISKAFKRKSRLLHPDKNADEASTEQFTTLHSAYETLRDATKRSHYDAHRFLQPILRRLGVDSGLNDLTIARVAQRLDEPGGMVEEVVMESSIVDELRQKRHLQAMERESRATLLQFETDIPGQEVILVCGTPKIVHHGKSLLLNFCNHAKGLSAPPGGLIFIVPSDMISRMPLFEQNFAALQQKFKAQITHVFAGRIQVTGPNQTEVVGQLLRWLQYRGRILLAIPGAAGDRELDVWMYQHHCEVQKIPCGPLLPDQMPDRITVLQLLRFALNRAQTPESEALIPLCVDVLKQNVLTEPLLRAMSSDAVYHEYSMLSIDQKAPLLCTLASMRSFRTQKIRLASEPLIATLQSLLDFLGSPDGAFLRSRGILAAADFADGQWHGWPEVLGSKALEMHWRRLVLYSSSQGGVALPMEWYLPEVIQMVLKGDDVQVQVSPHGVRIAQQLAPTPEEKPRSTTLVEDAEDVIYEALEQTRSASMSLDEAVQQVQKRQKQEEVVSKQLFHQHSCFYVTEFPGTGTFVQLSPASREKAKQRSVHKGRRSKSASELRVARLASKQFLSGSCGAQLPVHLPSAFHTPELCGLFLCWSETCSNPELAVAILQRLCKMGPQQLTTEILPFNVVQLMQGVISFQKASKAGKKSFDHGVLMVLMDAAAADICAEGGISAPLYLAADYMSEAIQTPFFGMSWKDQPMLLVSASKRIIKELTPDSGDRYPACLSANYSSLPAFANLCQLFTNFYSHAYPHLVPEQKEHVAEAFCVLAKSCEQFSSDISAQSPLALRRLVTAFATLAKVDSDDRLTEVAHAGLLNLRPVLARSLRAIGQDSASLRDRTDKWDMGKLACVARAYRNEPELFMQIAEASANMAQKLQRKGTLQDASASCFDVMKAFIAEGLLVQLQPLLKTLKQQKILAQKLQKLTELNVPWKTNEEKATEVRYIMTAFVCTEEPGTDDFAVKLFKSNGMDMAVPAMLVMLDNLPKSKLKQLLLEKVLAAKFQLFQLPANDLRRLVRACQDEEDMAQLQQTFCQRWLLDSVPTEHKDLQDLVNTLEHFLAPFANTKISVPRLESLCAGRLMQWLAQAGTTKADEVVKAGMQFRVEALASMPSLVVTLTSALTADATGEWQNLFQRMEAACSLQAESKDERLDSWVRQIEEAIVACGMPEVQWDDMELKLANDLPKEIQDALGQSWLPIILTRSKRVKWRGGGAVQVEVQTLPQRERSRSRSRCEGKVTDLSTKRSASANSAPKSKAQKTTPSPPSPKLSPQAAASEIEAVPSSGGKQELTEWLRSADPAGRLLKYEAKLTENLDELTDILVFVRDKESAEPSTLDKIDPWFFKCIECTQAGHKMLLAKAIMRLHAESAQ